jgi:hypothetical protein
MRDGSSVTQFVALTRNPISLDVIPPEEVERFKSIHSECPSYATDSMYFPFLVEYVRPDLPTG